MIPDPGRADLVRYLGLCIRRRVRAERLLARRRELEREAEAQLLAWDADRRADHLAEVADRLDALSDNALASMLDRLDVWGKQAA